MGDQRKRQLTDLGPEALADALLELSAHDDVADDLVERMIATPKENVQRFKAKLSGLRRSRRVFSWSEAADLAHELRVLLRDLEAGVGDPCTGSELLAAFYETDESTFERCDDSNGCVGDVYRYDAKELFVDYAGRCDEKDRLSHLVLKLNYDDAYGVRDTLIDCATDYLPGPSIRAMIIELQGAADKESDEYKKRHRLRLVESLARQIGDAQLFEETRIASQGEPSTAACVDIAQVYLLDRADQLNGGQYGILLPLVEAMESEQRPLVASVLYRALLDSILQRGQTRTYSHGVRYLKKLDRLAGSITDWLGLDDHTTYTQQVR